MSQEPQKQGTSSRIVLKFGAPAPTPSQPAPPQQPIQVQQAQQPLVIRSTAAPIVSIQQETSINAAVAFESRPIVVSQSLPQQPQQLPAQVQVQVPQLPEQQIMQAPMSQPTSLIQIRGGGQQQVVVDKPTFSETMIKLGGITAGPAPEEQKKTTAFISIPVATTQPALSVPTEASQQPVVATSTIRLPIFQQQALQQPSQQPQQQAMVVDQQYGIPAQQQPLTTTSQLIKVGGAEPSPKQAEVSQHVNISTAPPVTTAPKKPNLAQPSSTTSVPIRLNILSGVQPQHMTIQQPQQQSAVNSQLDQEMKAVPYAQAPAPCLIKIGGGQPATRTPEPSQKAVVIHQQTTSAINIMAAPQTEMVQEMPPVCGKSATSAQEVSGNRAGCQITLKFGGVGGGSSQATLQQPVNQPIVIQEAPTSCQPQTINLQQQQPQLPFLNSTTQQQNTTNTATNIPTTNILPNYPVYVPQVQNNTQNNTFLSSQQTTGIQQQPQVTTSLIQIGGSSQASQQPSTISNANAGKITFNLNPAVVLNPINNNNTVNVTANTTVNLTKNQQNTRDSAQTTAQTTAQQQPQVIQPQVIQPQVIQPQVIQPQVILPQVIQPQIIQPQVIQPQVIQPQVIQPQIIQPATQNINIQMSTATASNQPASLPVEPQVPQNQQQVVMPARSLIKISMPAPSPPQIKEQPPAQQPSSQSTIINPQNQVINQVLPQQQAADVEMTSTSAAPIHIVAPEQNPVAPQPMAAITIKLGGGGQQMVKPVMVKKQPEPASTSTIISFPTTTTNQPAATTTTTQMDWQPRVPQQTPAAHTQTHTTGLVGQVQLQSQQQTTVTNNASSTTSIPIVVRPYTAAASSSSTAAAQAQQQPVQQQQQHPVVQQQATQPNQTAYAPIQSQPTTVTQQQPPSQAAVVASQPPSSSAPQPTQSQAKPQVQVTNAANVVQQSRFSKSQPKRLNLLEFYNVTKRTVAFELDPETKTYRGQVRVELALKMVASDSKTPSSQQQSVLEKEIEQCKSQGMSRVLLEANIMAKQVKVVEVCLLGKDSETGEFKKEQTQKFADGNLADPIQQAKVNPELYQGLSRHLYQLEDVQKSQIRKYLTHGTVQLKLKKKMFQFKNAEKIKKELFFMIDFLCEHITDVGGVKCVKYRKELADQLASSANNTPIQSCNEYFYTSDEPNQSISWLPQLVGSQKMASAWHLQFLVPKEYTVLASGKKVDSSIEDDTALYEYDITEAERTIPDRIGFLICPTPLQTPFDVQGKKELGVANFLSRQKQANFNPKLASDTIDFICSLMSQRNYPSKNTQICFLPNLFPAKFPKQSLCFAGGLYMLDQELLYKPNQLDKRHKLYKQMASCLTFAFFGGKVREAEWSDTWLLVAIRERVGDRFTKSKCGALLYRYHVMKRIEKLYKLMKEGIETHPLQRTKIRDPETCPELKGLGCPDPADQIANDIFYRKCGLVMQMIELKIGELLDTILKEMYQEAVQSKDRVLQLESFRATYKKVCGIRAKEIFNNWIFSTSCPKLTLNYEFNKRYNSLDLTLKQESAAATSMRVHKNVQSKIDKIFGMSGQDLDRELLGEGAEANETFNVDQKQVCKRWFTGSVNVVICQADGGGGEILKQQHKMTLKNYKSTVSAHITLLGRVRRTQNRKKDLDYLPQAAMQTPQETHHVSQAARRLGPGGRPHHGPHGQRGRGGSDFGASDAATSQAAQMMLNQDVQKFEMNEFELEDFPPETKNIFRKELDNNPVLWIRVDPGMEYIRKVKVVQKKRNNWLFQLLREQDIVGQIEAVRQLHKFNEDLVYEILKTVSRNENYFFKVRKEVLKTMHKMEISVINEHLSHEAFLLKCFNQKNFDKVTGFYRENNFTNLLQYYLDRSVLKYISKSKEEKLNLTMTSQQRLDELHMKQSKLANESNMEDAASDKSPQKERSIDPNSGEQLNANMQAPSTMIQINFVTNQLTGIDTKGQKNGKSRTKVRSSALARQHMIDMSDYRITTDKVAQMLLKVLEQNDNTENYFDDSFLIRDILASLGRLDNLNYIAKISTEIYRQFKLDQISNSSPMFSITTGAIKGYFNMRKQIYRFVHHKRQHIEPSDPFYQNRVKMHGGESGYLAGHNSGAVVKDQRNAEILAKDQIAETEKILDLMKEDVDGLLMDPLTPLQLRLFIFDEEIKNIIFYKSLPLVKGLQVIFDAIFNLQAKMEIRFAAFCLRELVMFLESVKFVQRINFTELFIESEATIHLIETVWSLICLPHGFLSSDMTFWAKRFVNRVYGRVLPKFLMNRADMTLEPAIYQTDEIWAKTEASLAAEEQQRTQLAELQKQEQKNKHLMATHQFQSAQQAQGDQAMTVAQQHTNANVLAFRSNSGNERIVAGGSKQHPLKKKPINRQGSIGDKQIIQIYNRGQAQSGGITIKATNNSQASMPSATNDHILNISSGGSTLQRHTSAKISIPGPSSTIRVTATAAPTTSAQTAINIESKLQSELREVNTASILASSGSNPLQSQVYNDGNKDAAGNKKSAVVHIGPQTHTAITLQGPHSTQQAALQQQQALEAGKTTGAVPMQLIVLRGQSVQAPMNATEQQLQQMQGEANFGGSYSQLENNVILSSGNDQEAPGINMITTGTLGGGDIVMGHQAPIATGIAAESEDEEDEEENSKSMVRILPRAQTADGNVLNGGEGNQRVANQVDEDEDEDEDHMMSDEEYKVVQQRLILQAKQQHQRAAYEDDDGDAQMMDDDDDDEYGDQIIRQRQQPRGDDDDEDDDEDGDGNESVYDPFAAEKMEDTEMQKCWLILGKIYYHYEVTDFLDPVTPDTFGDEKLYEEYCSVVAEPMDIATIMAKMRAAEYESKYLFRRDVMLIFENCREFNEAGTEIVHCANSLTIEFNGLWQEYDMN